MNVILISRPLPLPGTRRLASSGAGRSPVRSAIYAIASMVEPDRRAVDHWYQATPINELDGGTAQDLVAEGQGARVLSFLSDIVRGRRD